MYKRQILFQPLWGYLSDILHQRRILVLIGSLGVAAASLGLFYAQSVSYTHLDVYKRQTLGDVVGRFKSLTTRHYIESVHTKQWTPFARRLWQRNYYEHIIRDEKDYQAIYEYVLSNPQNWMDDPERPAY